MRRRLLVFLLLVLLLCVACVSKPVIPTALPLSPVSMPTVVPSATATLASSPTSLPTLASISLPTAASTPVPEPTLLRISRPTPGPTLTNDEEQTLVLKLLKENGGCRLPCWWGFTPGEAAWPVAESFFLSNGKRIGEYRDPRSTVYSLDFHIPLHNSQINQDYYTIGGNTIDLITVGAVPPESDNELDYRDIQFAEDWKSYMLPQMLAVYGQPRQILLRTFSDTPTGWLPFNLLLFYPEQGILVSYYGPAGKNGKTLRMCPYQVDVRLWLWSSEHAMPLEHLAGMGSSPIGDMSGFRSLEEATGMSVEQFYQSFVQPSSKACLETPTGMW
jgi:hypothetical protein